MRGSGEAANRARLNLALWRPQGEEASESPLALNQTVTPRFAFLQEQRSRFHVILGTPETPNGPCRVFCWLFPPNRLQ